MPLSSSIATVACSSAWFWRSLLASSGHTLGWWPLLRAYFCGHLGKYIPGKAGVLVIRAGLLKSSGVPAATAGRLSIGTMISRPWTSSAERLRAAFMSVTGPSYSSP